MRRVAAVAGPFFLILAGCLSAPIPQELVDLGPKPPLEAVSVREIVRLSNAGISDEVIVGLIRSRGVSDRPGVAGIAMLRYEGVSSPVQLVLLTSSGELAVRKPGLPIIYRELFIPLWPSYARGRWHLGLRFGCYVRSVEGKVPYKPESPPPRPRIVDP